MMVACTVSAPDALAEVQFGGSELYKGVSPTKSISLVQRDDGTVLARVVGGLDCGGYYTTRAIVRVRGRLNGANFVATGKAKFNSGTLRLRMVGTIGPDGVTGTLRSRHTRCVRQTRPFLLRPAAAPAGAPAVPAPGSLFFGMSSQSASGVRLPVTIRITKNGRMYAVWQAMVKCGKVGLAVLDATPTRAIRADGTFTSTQTYLVRYKGSADERYRVTFNGRFLADGATGTLSARLLFRSPGKRYRPCLSGRQTWSARP